MSETNNSYKIYASKDYVDERALPQDAGEYKQLVTGADGEWKAEERLGYKAVEEVFIVLETTLSFSENDGLFSASITAPDGFDFVIGEKYDVVWDGVEYKDLVAFDDDGYVSVGAPYTSITDELPFNIYAEDSAIYACTNSTAETHTISITSFTETPHPIPDEYMSFLNAPKEIIPTNFVEIKYATYLGWGHEYSESILDIKAGQTYRATIDGVVYEVVAGTYQDRNYVGNPNLVDSDAESNGLPFVFRGYFNDVIAVSFESQDWVGMHTIGLSEANSTLKPEYLPNPIPAEYLPTTFVPTAVIKSSDYDNALAGVANASVAGATYECINMTFEEAWAIVASGKPLTAVMMYYGDVPQISYVQGVIIEKTDEGEPKLIMMGGQVVEWTADGMVAMG